MNFQEKLDKYNNQLKKYIKKIEELEERNQNEEQAIKYDFRNANRFIYNTENFIRYAMFFKNREKETEDIKKNFKYFLEDIKKMFLNSKDNNFLDLMYNDILFFMIKSENIKIISDNIEILFYSNCHKDLEKFFFFKITFSLFFCLLDMKNYLLKKKDQCRELYEKSLFICLYTINYMMKKLINKYIQNKDFIKEEDYPMERIATTLDGFFNKNFIYKDMLVKLKSHFNSLSKKDNFSFFLKDILSIFFNINNKKNEGKNYSLQILEAINKMYNKEIFSKHELYIIDTKNFFKNVDIKRKDVKKIMKKRSLQDNAQVVIFNKYNEYENFLEFLNQFQEKKENKKISQKIQYYYFYEKKKYQIINNYSDISCTIKRYKKIYEDFQENIFINAYGTYLKKLIDNSKYNRKKYTKKYKIKIEKKEKKEILEKMNFLSDFITNKHSIYSKKILGKTYEYDNILSDIYNNVQEILDEEDGIQYIQKEIDNIDHILKHIAFIESFVEIIENLLVNNKKIASFEKKELQENISSFFSELIKYIVKNHNYFFTQNIIILIKKYIPNGYYNQLEIFIEQRIKYGLNFLQEKKNIDNIEEFTKIEKNNKYTNLLKLQKERIKLLDIITTDQIIFCFLGIKVLNLKQNEKLDLEKYLEEINTLLKNNINVKDFAIKVYDGIIKDFENENQENFIENENIEVF